MKRTAILCLMFAITSISKAQTSHVQFGLKAGLNVSSFTGKDAMETHNLNSWHAGGFATFPISKSFAIQPELIYSREGTTAQYVDYIFQYVRVPLMLQFRHQSGFQAEFGMQGGVLLKAEGRFDEEKIKLPSMEFFSTGLAMGFGYTSPFGAGVHFRYAVGMSNIGNEAVARINTLSLSLSYALESRKK